MARKLIVEVVLDSAAYSRQIKQATAKTTAFSKDLENVGRGSLAATVGFKGLGRSLAFASTSFLSGAGIVAGAKASVAAASDLNEQIGKTEVVFGKSAAAVEDWSKTLVSSFALSQRQALTAASSFGALFRPLGFTAAEAAKQSEKLTQLGADLASFYNTDVQSALDAIQSGLVGEVEPLRRYGLVLSEARVQQEALRETGLQHAAQLTDQEKVVARLNLIFQGSKQAQGDSARSSERFAKQTKELSANLDDLASSLGKKLLPAITDVEKKLNKQAENVDKQGTGANNTKKSVEALGAIWGHVQGPAERLGKAVWNLNYAVNVYRFDTMLLAKVQDTFFSKTMASVGAVNLLTEGLKKTGQAAGKVDLRTAGGIVIPKGVKAKDINTLFGVSTEQVEQRNNWFDRMIGRQQLRAGLLTGIDQQTAAYRHISAELTKRIAITNDITRKQRLIDERLQTNATIAGLQAQKAQETKAARDAAREVARQAAEDAKQEKIGWLEFAYERAQVTKTLSDDLKTATANLDFWKKQAATGKRTLEEARQVFHWQQEIANLRGKSDALGTKFRPVNANAFIQSLGLGLTPDQVRRLRAGIVQFGPGGTVPGQHTGAFALAGGMHVESMTVNLHGIQNTKQLEEELAKRAKARPHTRRGAR